MNNNSLGNFKYFMGLFMLIILSLGLFILNISQLADSYEGSGVARSGANKAGGKYTLTELIEKYDLDKEEFYAAIKLPADYVDNDKLIIKLVRSGKINYNDINGYMRPIIDAYNQQQNEQLNNQNSP